MLLEVRSRLPALDTLALGIHVLLYFPLALRPRTLSYTENTLIKEVFCA